MVALLREVSPAEQAALEVVPRAARLVGWPVAMQVGRPVVTQVGRRAATQVARPAVTQVGWRAATQVGWQAASQGEAREAPPEVKQAALQVGRRAA